MNVVIFGVSGEAKQLLESKDLVALARQIKN